MKHKIKRKNLLNIICMFLVLLVVVFTACDKDVDGGNEDKKEVLKETKDIEKEEIEKEEFDWVIEVDDHSQIMTLSDGSKVLGRLRMRIANKSGKLYGFYKGSAIFRLLTYNENVGLVLGQPFPMLVAMDYESKDTICDVKVLTEEGPKMPSHENLELAPLEVPGEAPLADLIIPKDEAPLVDLVAPKDDQLELAPLFISNWEGAGYNTFALSSFATLISEETPIDDDIDIMPFTITTEGPVVKIMMVNPIGMEMVFTGKMIGYGKDSKAADKPLEEFPASEKDETWPLLTMQN